jgi:catechol 2,3-dioxygenase-like lactoylglutathione lyase family enzyme
LVHEGEEESAGDTGDRREASDLIVRVELETGVLKIQTLHHVSLPTSDLQRSIEFYEGVIGLEPMERPPFDFAGRWYKVGDRSLHLIVPADGQASTFRHGKGIDSRDAHFAIRVASYRAAVAHLESKGFRQSDESQPMRTAGNPNPMRLSPRGAAGFPQIYVLDPDDNVIEINAAVLD